MPKHWGGIIGFQRLDSYNKPNVRIEQTQETSFVDCGEIFAVRFTDRDHSGFMESTDFELSVKATIIIHSVNSRIAILLACFI